MKIFKKNKFLTKRRIILLICLLLIFSYALLQRKQGRPIFSVKPKPQSSKLIEEFNRRSEDFFYGQRILENVADFKKCTAGQYCIELENKDANWFGLTHNGYAIPLNNRDLTVKLTFKNEGKQAGVSFVGRLSAQGKEWWTNRLGLNVFAEYEYLKIFLETGDSKDPLELFSQKVAPEENSFHSLYLVFKNLGQKIEVLAPDGKTIKDLDLPKLYPPTFTKGLFPDNKLYLGLSLAPGSKLIISEFLGFSPN